MWYGTPREEKRRREQCRIEQCRGVGKGRVTCGLMEPHSLVDAMAAVRKNIQDRRVSNE